MVDLTGGTLAGSEELEKDTEVLEGSEEAEGLPGRRGGSGSEGRN